MFIYENTKSGFLDDLMEGTLVSEIEESCKELGVGVSPSEIQSWQNSLTHMDKVLVRSDIPEDAGVAIEYKIPLTSSRVDFMISGYNQEGNANLAIIELKQWDGTETQRVENKDGIVETWLGGDVRETTHPSYQAWSYAEFLEDFNKRIQEEPINLHPLAYLHNYDNQHRDEIDNETYRQYTERAPVYLQEDAKELRRFLEEKFDAGDGGEIVHNVDQSELQPSKSLQNAILEMIEGRDEFTLIDSQKVVFERAVELAKKSQEDGQKRVLLVEGEPGTGKTVVAINILSELIQNDLTAQYVSKNSAPRDVYEQKLRDDMMVKEIDHLFKGAGSYVDESANSIPALVADEAHRLNEESNFFGRGENQIMEIINAAKFSVFFIDEDQRVHIDDIGSNDEIRKHAEDLGAKIEEMELESQLRCNGSEDYIDWVDDVLEIDSSPDVDTFEMEYDIRIFDNPEQLHQAIERRNDEDNLSRVVAGYCWEWDTDEQDNPDVMDIEIGDYERSWNLDVSDPWAISEGSIDEVGCIHTCQGLEFDYVGVILGEDIKYRDGEIVTDFRERASQDRSIHGMKKMSRENPDQAEEKAEELIKNTYRTLMTRGMDGCYVYCCDDELQEYMRDRIGNVNSTL